MVDLETLSTRANAAIISIGACFFDPMKEIIGETFYREISLDSNIELSRHISGDTLMWWMQQSKQAREVFNPENNRLNLTDSLYSFNRFITHNANPEKVRLWSNSPSFDEVMLNTACLDTGTPWILSFWNTRCVRTVKGLCPDKVFQTWTKNNPREGYHNAMSDACYQAKYVSWILKSSGCEELF
jgi:hypothetical protein